MGAAPSASSTVEDKPAPVTPGFPKAIPTDATLSGYKAENGLSLLGSLHPLG